METYRSQGPNSGELQNHGRERTRHGQKGEINDVGTTPKEFRALEIKLKLLIIMTIFKTEKHPFYL